MSWVKSQEEADPDFISFCLSKEPKAAAGSHKARGSYLWRGLRSAKGLLSCVCVLLHYTDLLGEFSKARPIK